MDYIALLQDILQCNASQLPAEILDAVSLALSQAPATLLGQLTSVVLTSPAASPAFESCRAIFLAYVRGLIARQANTAKIAGSGWRERRQISVALDAVWHSLENQQGNATSRLAIASAGLASLAGRTDLEDALVYNPRRNAEVRFVRIWRELAHDWGSHSADSKSIAAWLTAESMVSASDACFRALPRPVLFETLIDALSHTYCNGRPFTSTNKEPPNDPNQETNADVLRQHLRAVASKPLFVSMGRLTRVTGRYIEICGSTDDARFIASALEGVERLAFDLRKNWFDCAMSSVQNAQNDDVDASLPWTILKSFLFALTMLYSSIVRLLVLQAPTTHSVPSAGAQRLVFSGIRTFSHLHYIALAFGDAGFNTYDHVLHGLSELALRCSEKEVLQVVTAIDAEASSSNASSSPHDSRPRFLYWLNTCDRLVPKLPSSYVERVFMRIRQYLEQNDDKQAFEDSHGFVLAALPAHPNTAQAFAPWYCQFLVRNKAKFSSEQFRLAFGVCVKSVKGLQADVAWTCISILAESAEAEISDSEQVSLQLQTLIEQLPHVSMDALEPFLALLRTQIQSLPNAIARNQAAHVLYDNLNKSRHIAQRIFLVKWWLANREALQQRDG